MMNKGPEAEVFEQCHGVPLDEPEPCLDCGKLTSSGLYLAGELRPLCPAHHLQLFQSESGKRLDAALQALNALGPRPPRLQAKELDAAAARELGHWLLFRDAERRNTCRAGTGV